ncbi:hypothetical protein BCD48_05040 [Pseudofrankia sp. BMG5.36]|nr:hypothetical protein BCD48_05040 [Pseudofrankia sp. BMG5.36]
MASIEDSVDRAAHANDLIWRNHPRPSQLRQLRADALRAALSEGKDATEIASRLGVRADDIAWMTSSETASWPAPPITP